MSEYAVHHYIEPDPRGWRVTEIAKAKYNDVLNLIKGEVTKNAAESDLNSAASEFERVGLQSFQTEHPTRNPEREG